MPAERAKTAAILFAEEFRGSGEQDALADKIVDLEEIARDLDEIVVLFVLLFADEKNGNGGFIRAAHLFTATVDPPFKA